MHFGIWTISPVIFNIRISLKIPSPNDFIEEGIVICIWELHPLKAYDPIDVTEEGITIWASDLHKLNV